MGLSCPTLALLAVANGAPWVPMLESMIVV
jgi:hypothetical protein